MPDEKRRPRVLVVVPTLNEARCIAQVLKTLVQGVDPGTVDAQFVVVDGYSSDDTPQIVQTMAAQEPRVKLLHNPKRLQSAAINLAVHHFGDGADILIRCDAHADYPERYIPRLIESLQEHEADAVVVPMDSRGDTCVRKAIAWVSDTKVGSGGSAHRGGKVSGWVDHGHHAAFRMESFRRAGGYDETFSHNEDAELDCRQRALGSRIFLDSNIRLGYFPRPTLIGLWRQYFNYGRGRSRTLRRHPDSLRARQFAVPAHVAICIAAAALSPWWPWLLLWPLAYLSALAATGARLAMHHRSLCGLLGGPAAFVMHTAWAIGLFTGFLTMRQGRWFPDQNAKSPPQIAYLMHFGEDPAYRRRVQMFRAGGAQVIATGFTRESANLHHIEGAPFHSLGMTEPANFPARVRSVVSAALKVRRWAPRFSRADAIVARNLECLALARLAAFWARPGTPIHYEVLDIHRLMLRHDWVGKGMRALEAWLMRPCQRLIISSPAYEVHYFSRLHRRYPHPLLIENKVFPMPATMPSGLRADTHAPVRVGYFGGIRCRKSVLMLSEIARAMPNAVEIHIRGKVAETAIPDFIELIKGLPNLHFHGTYRNPEDLPFIYGAVDIAWAIDLFEEGKNGLWLLPNRLYEGSLFGAVPLALSGTGTAEWMEQHQIGWVLQEFNLSTITNFLLQLTPNLILEQRHRILERGPNLFSCSNQECIELTTEICKVPAASGTQRQMSSSN